MRDVIEKFDFRNTIEKLDERNLLYLVMERFKKVDLHPDSVSNLEMGYIFEDLLRRFNEALNENPGEHYTPREVIRLMVNLLLSQDEEALAHNHVIRTVYDPCCGSGGMLTIAQKRIREINPQAEVYLFGQEVNPETYAISKSDMYLANPKMGIRRRTTLNLEAHFLRIAILTQPLIISSPIPLMVKIGRWMRNLSKQKRKKDIVVGSVRERLGYRMVSFYSCNICSPK